MAMDRARYTPAALREAQAAGTAVECPMWYRVSAPRDDPRQPYVRTAAGDEHRTVKLSVRALMPGAGGWGMYDAWASSGAVARAATAKSPGGQGWHQRAVLGVVGLVDWKKGRAYGAGLELPDGTLVLVPEAFEFFVYALDQRDAVRTRVRRAAAKSRCACR